MWLLRGDFVYYESSKRSLLDLFAVNVTLLSVRCPIISASYQILSLLYTVRVSTGNPSMTSKNYCL
jgi:hypothetical protein